MDGSQVELNLSEFNIMNNIIDSAVDDLLLKKSSANCDYTAIAGLLLPLCRLCAREDSQMMHISDVHMQIIGDLRIPGIDDTNLCSNICRSCNGFLEDFCKFRSLCEEGQKRIVAMLAERNVLPDFMKVDYTASKKDMLPSLLDDRPCTPETPIPNGIHRSSSEPSLLGSMEEDPIYDETAVKFESMLDSSMPISPVESSLVLNNKNPQTIVTKRARELVQSSEYAKSDESSDASCSSTEQLVISDYKHNDYPVRKASTGTANNATRQRSRLKPVASKPQIKEPKKPESRRRVVDGKFQWLCLDCEQMFGSSLQLKKHRRSCELVGSTASKRISTSICDICGKTLSTQAAMKLHRQQKHSPTTGATEQRVDTVPTELICHVCGRSCQSRRALRVHLYTHDSTRHVECQVCGKRFKRWRTLRIHMDVHSGTKHECETCGKKFLTIVTLKNHAKTHRADYLQHGCTMCPKRFGHPQKLQRHMLIHTGQYPHVCEICHAMFRTLGRYNRHMQRGHLLPTNLNVIEQNELNNSDDLIEYEPESDMDDMLQRAPGQLTQTLDHPGSTVANDTDDPFYSFIEG